MPEANTKQLYSNSTVQGVPLPLDILLSISSAKVAFSDTPVDGLALPATGELLVFYGDPILDCWVKFAATVVDPADATFVADLTFIPGGSVKVMDRNGAAAISIVGKIATPGTLIVEVASSYKDASKATQINRP